MRNAMLRTLLVAFALLSAAWAAPAIGPGSSWSEIKHTPNVYVKSPMILFGVRGITVTDVCISGDTLRAVSSDGVTLEGPVASHRKSYDIEVDEVHDVGEFTVSRVLFIKHLDLPACT